ncbi:TetR/AcrR family transcriptional regulator [Herbiconiux daphne]|uniref:TetR/AcrR family transcriptional regulator n=1 Tax=Herbiconiux daphne TaxID=2970914 RepID=A0ABT2H4F2_9MICO|nr:TetR/AcrR family transcriptional regulator [Herbiconiux daphne]MCS5734794.1 TetR/AcrR family transcriptional regulator [Herbiconiux daphne]
MTETATETAPDAAPMRDRILAAASQLFYAEGFRAVSAEKIIARVGITKVTFYRHFPSKDDLMVAYLEQRAALERGFFEQVRDTAENDPDAGFRLALQALSAAGAEPGYRGCPFINAAAEYADPEHPVRRIVARHRTWQTEQFARVARDFGVSEREAPAAAAELMVLRDGAAVGGYLDSPTTVARAVTALGRAALSAHLDPPVALNAPEPPR